MAYSGTDDGSGRDRVKKELKKKLEKAKELRDDRKCLLNETNRLAMPWRRDIGDDGQDPERLSEADLADMVDPTMSESGEDFASDMMMQFTPEHEPWTNMGAKETVPKDFRKEFERIAQIAQTLLFESLQESSYYDAAHECFTDLTNGTMGGRGTMPRYGGDNFEYEHIEPADLLLCQSPRQGLADGRFTEGCITRETYEEIYGAFAPYPEKYANHKPEQEVKVTDGFYRCWDSPKGPKAWRRCVMVEDELTFEKFVDSEDDIGFFVCRFKVSGRNPWGIGPAHRAQPLQRALNELCAKGMVALDMALDPPMYYFDDGTANFEQGVEAGDKIPVGQEFEIWQEDKIIRFDAKHLTETDWRQMIQRAYYQDKPEQAGKTPPTAEQWQSLEVRARQRWEIPRGKIVREWVMPIVRWHMASLVKLGQLDPIVRIEGARTPFRLRPNSPFQKARAQEKVVKTRENIAFVGQNAPDVIDTVIDLPTTIANMARESNDELLAVRSKQEQAEYAAQKHAAMTGGLTPDGGTEPV